MNDRFTFSDVVGIESVFEKIYLNYKNFVFYLDILDDDSLISLFDDILSFLYQHLTLLVKLLSNNIFDEGDLYE